MTIRIRDLPESARPRERLWSVGAEALSEVELIALILRGGRRGESALDLAKALLAEYGGTSGLAAAHPEELASRAGMGRAKSASLLAAFRLGTAVRSASATRALRTARDLFALVGPELRHLRSERVLVVVLNAGHRVRRIVRLSQGSADRSLLPVREVLNAVLRNDGRAFVVAHNHPSGDPEPSAADVEATRTLSEAAAVVGLRFLDHVIVTDATWTSLRDRGFLA